MACTPAQARRGADPDALHGVTLGLPSPADARPTPGIGCGQVSQDLPLRAHKALVAAFSDAGANATNSDTGRWVLKVALREATMGEENTREHRGDRAPANSGIQQAADRTSHRWTSSPASSTAATATRWWCSTPRSRGRGRRCGPRTVTGRARSAPCVQAIDKVREALDDAVDELRDRVLPLLRSR